MSAEPRPPEDIAAAPTPAPAPTPANLPAASDPADANTLTPEEQLARFAEELKENDRGHQPC